MTRQRRGACQPGATPRERVRSARKFRPARAEESCALAGRTDQFRNPGRCPGLECGGAFSAEIKVVQIRIHESHSWPFMRWLLESINSAAQFDEVWQWRKQRSTL